MHGKATTTCPDCRLDRHRQKQRDKVEAKRQERERMERINASAPPASTVDGQLQRWRDQQREELGAPPLRVDVDDAAAAAVQPPPLRSKAYKPGHRVEKPAPGKVTGELPWWARAPRHGMTETAEQEQRRMVTERPKVAASVKGDVNG